MRFPGECGCVIIRFTAALLRCKASDLCKAAVVQEAVIRDCVLDGK
jgi:hypothetical protein